MSYNPIQDSLYIFLDNEGSLIFPYFGSFGYLAAVCVYIKVYRFDWANFNKEEKAKPIIGFTVILGVVVAAFVSIYKEKHRLERIYDYGAITKGITVQKVTPGRGSPYIEYRFSVDNKTYSAASGYYYDQEYIENIKVPDGFYRVIYNRKNPDESVMDFKIPIDSVNK